MNTWKHAEAADRKRYMIITEVCESFPRIPELLFLKDKPALAQSPKAWLRWIEGESGWCAGEKILAKLCLDIWSQDAKLPILELFRLDPGNFNRAIKGIVDWRRL
jgi:hypothetical protein